MSRRTLFYGAGAAAVAAIGGGAISVASMGSLTDYQAAMAALRAPLPEAPAVKDLLRYATLAANGHNTQPWKFRVSEGRIELLPDFTRRTPVVDPDDHHLWASLGCAAENLSIASAAMGKPGDIRFDPGGEGSVIFEYSTGTQASTPLFGAIPKRQSSRADYTGAPVPPSSLQALAAAAAAVDGVDVAVLTERRDIARARDLVIAGNTAQMNDPAFVRELRDWLRFSPRAALGAGDGLFSASSGNPMLPDWLGPTLFGFAFTLAAENAKYARHVDTSSGVAVFCGAKNDREHWMLAGRACQRFQLQATVEGLKTAFVNQPAEVPELRADMAALAGLPGRRPNIVLRFGYGPELPFSPRRAPIVI
ncbi:MAG TPA: Tat pathway signal protein [Alphaproteobacteria bacterium]|nr:Tat pathway signal protein [Alphaproteobacteria bacterium]HAJ46162.1 Tat pathway signal protein [Alphaproteobacteria bacterium]